MKRPCRIWIDLENSPHVPFFVPIVLELERAGCEVVLTARDFAQTRPLVERAGLNARIVGGTYGKSAAMKTLGIILRALRLAAFLRTRRISLAVGHGSRGLLLAARLLRIPTLTLYDYEGASVRLFHKLSTYVMTPEAIPFSVLEILGLAKSKHLTYPGLKEDVYVPGFQHRGAVLKELDLDPSRIIVTVRPPSQTAHYRSAESFRLYHSIMQILAAREDLQIVLLPREKIDPVRKDESATDRAGTTSGSIKNMIIPNAAIDGLDLLYYSDLVISGGGTMNREAAALGVPCVTIFKGEMGAVDRMLIREGKMVGIDRPEELLPLLKKRVPSAIPAPRDTQQAVVETILRLAKGKE